MTAVGGAWLCHVTPSAVKEGDVAIDLPPEENRDVLYTKLTLSVMGES